MSNELYDIPNLTLDMQKTLFAGIVGIAILVLCNSGIMGHSVFAVGTQSSSKEGQDTTIVENQTSSTGYDNDTSFEPSFSDSNQTVYPASSQTVYPDSSQINYTDPSQAGFNQFNYSDSSQFNYSNPSPINYSQTNNLDSSIPNEISNVTSQKVKWQLVFLSPNGGCTNYQYQMANTYDEIASKYFKLYKFKNFNYPPKCISDKKYAQFKIQNDTDLVVLVYDNEIGKRELHSKDIGGLYNHIGSDKTRNHTIIICDCSNFGYSDPAWILSHEISHFITYYLGFDIKVTTDKIHAIDKKYDQCVEGQRDSFCAGVKTHVTGDNYFTRAIVMAPYEPAIGMIRQDTSYDSSNVVDSQVMGMQKEITKLWLAGQINDTAYIKVLGHSITSGESKTGLISPDVIIEDGSNGKESNSIFYDDMMKSNSDLLKRVPFKSDNSTISKIPDWFKSKAGLYSQDQLSDGDFFSEIKHLLP